MLRQGPLGTSRPPRFNAEPSEAIGESATAVDRQRKDSANSREDSMVGEPDVGQDASDDEKTFVYEDKKLEELPARLVESITRRKSLQKLSLKGNRLPAIPDSLGLLTQLYYVNLSHNNFTEVPECIRELKNLEILDMSSNGLKTLPSFLTELPQLIGLSLVANNFEVLPPVIADLPKLVILELEDNPIRIPSQLPAVEDAEDDESWLQSVQEYVRTHRSELENALKRPANKQLQKLDEMNRTVPERLRSSSESGVSLLAAKRMGFVMSRNATDQSYVASLHARGSSHDAHMIDAAPNSKHQQHSQSHAALPLAGTTPTPTQAAPSQSAAAPGENYAHMRSLSSFAVTSEYSELPPPAPRSPLSRSPFGSPWGSPRPSLTDTEPPASVSSNRLSTLAEEHDANSDADVTEPDTSFAASREASTSSTDNTSTFTLLRRGSNAMPPLPEMASENSPELESPGTSQSSLSTLFKDSYNEPTSRSFVASSGGPGSSFSSAHRTSSSTPSVSTPTSATASAIESISFTLEEFCSLLKSIAASLPPVVIAALREVEDLTSTRHWGKALASMTSLLDKLTVPRTFQQVASRLTRRQQRQFSMSIMLTFPELESAWRQLQRTKLLPLTMDTSSNHHTLAQDEQLHTQLEHATKSTQSVLSLLNSVIAKSAVAAADGPEATSEMAMRVRDLSSVCIRCSGATRSVRQLLDRQAMAHARTLQLSERRRFWEEVNMFLKAVIAILAGVKAALPNLPLLADSHVGSEVAKLSRVAKEIPPLLEQSSYRVLLDSGGSAMPDGFDLPTPGPITGIPSYAPSMNSPSIQQQLQQSGQIPPVSTQPLLSSISQTPGVSQISLPPPTPLTASLGAAAQALLSPNERVERAADGYIQYGMHGFTDHQQ